MSEVAKYERRKYMREYMRKYRKYNKDKIREIQTRYWEKKFRTVEKNNQCV